MNDRPLLAAIMRAAAARLVASPTPHLDVRVLVKHALGFDDATLIAASGDPVSAQNEAALEALIERRMRGEPVAYITGRREFWSLDIEVAPGILVPRADSETLIEAIVSRRSAKTPLSIIDLGCGSGVLLCALLSAFPKARGLGVDIDPAAVAVTARNIGRLGFSGRAHVSAGDWFDGVVGEFDVIVSNPPYIRTIDRDTLPREVRDFESPLALFAGEDGLDAYRNVLAAAPSHLATGGLMALEFGEGQAKAVNEIASAAFPAAQFAIENDLSGKPRSLVIDLRSAAN